jgi:hypothetical protein
MEVRLLISVPSCREWKSAFGSSFVGLNVKLMHSGLRDHKLTALYPDIAAQASCLSQAREKALSKAIDGNFTHWLSLDDDMVFPCDIVDRFLARDKAVVTANYRRKSPKVSGVCMGIDGQLVDSTGKTGLEKIGWMGGGMFLVDIENIKHIPQPRFEVVWCPELKDYYDQDQYFSAKLRQGGVDIWCDHDLSQSIKHIGDTHFEWDQEIK